MLRRGNPRACLIERRPGGECGAKIGERGIGASRPEKKKHRPPALIVEQRLLDVWPHGGKNPVEPPAWANHWRAHAIRH